jgi:hypothetical protein
LLDDAVAAFLDSVTERSFDEPLVALLRSLGFTDLHLVHGQREFGKDVIGRRDGAQWALQSKAGDIGQAEWRAITGQLDELRLVNLGHGSFNTCLPRHPVLVTTGRLVGNAPDLYRDYNERARQRGEPELDLWTKDTLIGYLSGDPEALLRGWIDGQLLAALGSADRSATMADLESFYLRWADWDTGRLASVGVIEASLIGERLRTAKRLDLACHTALCLVRASWTSGSDNDASTIPADAAGALFETYARELWDERGTLLDEKWLVGYSGFAAWVSYPVRCSRIAEILGLLSIRLQNADPELSAQIARWLTEFAVAQPGTAHPISDQYAVSLIPFVIATATNDHSAAMQLLHRATVWLADRYERDALGLAGVDASPVEEIERLLGSPFEVVDRPRERASLIATVLLDLACLLGAHPLYADIYNDIRAVGIYPYTLRMADGTDQFLRMGESNLIDPNVDFAEEIDGDKETAPHHLDASGQRLCESGRVWDLLAISSALRDRYYYRALDLLVHASVHTEGQITP